MQHKASCESINQQLANQLQKQLDTNVSQYSNIGFYIHAKAFKYLCVCRLAILKGTNDLFWRTRQF